ncbi:MAG TPA: RDD family protein [Candidatus Sulfotelmatobacter sp.]|jgi:uncharacterized RDD family membrane protein YckC
MNCLLCGEVCNCVQETGPASLPRWVTDAAVNPPSGGEPPVERKTSSDTNATTPHFQTEESHGGAPASNLQTEETGAWRDELANRLSSYRARRKPRPPRYPSLRLVFDQPVFHGIGAGDETAHAETLGAFASVSQDALALDPFISCDSSFLEPGMSSAPATRPVGDDPSPVTSAPLVQRSAKIIEFPCLASAAPPVPLNELAGPVLRRPRILDVPDVVLPPPALGGISIESAQPQVVEKRPGIDVPLESAPLGRRLFASTIDAIIVAVAVAVAGSIFWKVAGFMPPRFQLLTLAATTPCLLWVAYQYLLVVYAGSTPGLRLAKLELTCFSGKPASRSLRRWRVLASYLSALSLGMGYAWVFLDEDCLCWHDRITRTYLAPKTSAGLSSSEPTTV